MSKSLDTSIKLSVDNEYISWIKEIKDKIYRLQIKASIAVNVELLSFYWDLGREICEKQSKRNWGDAIIEHLSKDLHNTFPEIKGFSRSNLFYVKKWYLFYSEQIIIQQAVGQISLPANIDTLEKVQQLVGQIPWGHNILIITKIKDIDEDDRTCYEKLPRRFAERVLFCYPDSRPQNNRHEKISNHGLTSYKEKNGLPVFDLLVLKKPIKINIFLGMG